MVLENLKAYLEGRRLFDDIAMFDHPLSHRVAEKGVSHQTMQNEILAENLVIKPWPQGFDPDGFPFRRFG